MKVLYPAEIGYSEGEFRPGYSVKQMRLQEARATTTVSERWISSHRCLCAADARWGKCGDKIALMRSTLPTLQSKVRRLVGKRNVPIVLIGGITYSVCAEALRLDGHHVVNGKMMNHPARGGQKLFRAQLAACPDRVRRTMTRAAANQRATAGPSAPLRSGRADKVDVRDLSEPLRSGGTCGFPLRPTPLPYVMKTMHDGVPTPVYCPVNRNWPVFRSTRNDVMASLRWLQAYRKAPPGAICMCLG